MSASYESITVISAFQKNFNLYLALQRWWQNEIELDSDLNDNLEAIILSQESQRFGMYQKLIDSLKVRGTAHKYIEYFYNHFEARIYSAPLKYFQRYPL